MRTEPSPPARGGSGPADLRSGLLRPAHPERICWGCDAYCRAEDLRCGNGTVRTPHPIELFGADWCADGAEPHEEPRSS